MVWAAVCGFAGVPIAVIGHYGIYQLLKPYSRKYSRLYAVGILGFLAFGGAGVHVSSVEAAWFYQNMNAASPGSALEATVDFAACFLLPLYAVLLLGWGIMVYAHIRAVSAGLSPLPRWGWIFSMPVGTALFSLVGLLGNHDWVNAIVVGAFSLGNIWSLAGHLWMLRNSNPSISDRGDAVGLEEKSGKLLHRTRYFCGLVPHQPSGGIGLLKRPVKGFDWNLSKGAPIHSIPCRIAQPLKMGSKNYNSVM